MMNEAEVNKFLENYRDAKHLRQVFVFGSKFEFAYVKNHKAGSTSVLGSILERRSREENVPFEPQHIDHIHRHQGGVLPKTRYLTPTEILGRAQNPDCFTFTFIREPVSRVISAFEDKIRVPSPQRWRFLDHLGYEESFPITLKEFILAMHHDPSIMELDPHWRPQHKEISYGLIDYDHIGILPNMDVELPRILARLFPDHDPTPYSPRQELGHRTRANRIAKKLDDEDREILEALYADDVRMYNEVLEGAYALEV